MIADNRLAELAGWDDAALVAEIERLREDDYDLSVLGWPDEELQEMLAVTDQQPVDDEPPPPPEESEADKLREKWGTESGQVWEIPSKHGGVHRIVCGDCADASTVERLMRGERATLVFADPPYGVSIGAKNRVLNEVAPANRCTDDLDGDTEDAAQLYERLLPAFRLVRTAVMADDCSVFVTAPQGGDLGMMMMMMMRDAGLPVRHVLIWRKDTPTFSAGRLDYDYQHEPILFTWRKRHKRYKRGPYTTSVWDIQRPRANREHPTMKPVELVENAILNHTDAGDIVYDPFLGSGTTLVACERTGRIGRGVEIEPKYVAVTLQRLADMGLEPRLASQHGGNHDA